MMRTVLTRARFWAFFTFLFVGMGLALNAADAPTASESDLLLSVNEKCTLLPEDFPLGECVTGYVQVDDFNPQTRILSGKIYFSFPEKYGTNFPSTVQVRQSTYISLDAATLETGLVSAGEAWNENDLIGGLDFEITATNYEYKTRTSDSYFPFDRYSATLTGIVSVQTEGADTPNNTDDDYFDSLPIQYVSYTGSVANYSLVLDYAYSEEKSREDFSENLDDGNLVLLIKVERPILTKAIVFILGLLFMSGGVLLLFLLRAIRIKKRPAQLTGLVWGASTAFTMIQARSLFPGDPRNGVKLDLFVFYPLLSLCFISVILIFREWVRQEHTPRELPPSI